MDGQTQQDSTNTYWPTLKGKDLATALQDKDKAWFESAKNRGLIWVWIVAYAAYYGQDANSFNSQTLVQIGFTGYEAEFMVVFVNEVRAFIRQQNTMVLGNKPAFQCLASNSDHKTLVSTDLANTIVKYLYKRYAGGDGEESVAESDGVVGAGFGHLRWDFDGGDLMTVQEPVMDEAGQPMPNPQTGEPLTAAVKKKSGAPYVTTCYPWNVVQEPRASGRHMWRCIRESDNRWNLAAQFPEQRDAILAVESKDQYDFRTLFGIGEVDIANKDTCTVKHFYHVDCKAVPGGRYAIVYGDLILYDGPCPVDEDMPIEEMSSGKYIETNFAYADSWGLLIIQQVLNQLCSDEFSNFATFGRQSIAMEKGTEVTVDALATGGKAFFYPVNGKPPSPVLFTESPKTVPDAKAYYLKRMESITGLFAAARGDPEPNVRSGEMQALNHSIALEFQAPRISKVAKYRAGIANKMLNMMRRYGSTPFLVEVVGKEDLPYIHEFTTQDLSGFKRVIIEEVHPLQASIAGRLKMLQELQTIDPKERAAAWELLETGNSSAFMHEDTAEALQIRRENEDLLTGERPVFVTQGENPFKHYKKHFAELQRILASDEQNPEAIARYQQHLLETQKEYYMMDPAVCMLMEIPPPPPMPGTPMFAMQQSLAMSGMDPSMAGPGAGPQPQPGGQSGPSAAQSGGGKPAPKKQPTGGGRDVTGTKLPEASQPPAGA